jgi:heme-degrading monooxygenase HmoA
MYLRITRGPFDPATADQVVPLAEEVQAVLARLPGFEQVYQALDRSAGTTATISLWDTEEHARFSRDELGDIIARIVEAGVQLDPPEVLEVV